MTKAKILVSKEQNEADDALVLQIILDGNRHARDIVHVTKWMILDSGRLDPNFRRVDRALSRLKTRSKIIYIDQKTGWDVFQGSTTAK